MSQRAFHSSTVIQSHYAPYALQTGTPCPFVLTPFSLSEGWASAIDYLTKYLLSKFYQTTKSRFSMLLFLIPCVTYKTYALLPHHWVHEFHKVSALSILFIPLSQNKMVRVQWMFADA